VSDRAAVLVDGLVVRFKELEAVRGLSFSVAPGEIFGLLGPNGAGKTTTIRVLTTLLQPSV
jgi:ABC-2 type transport system ATP-binding protein